MFNLFKKHNAKGLETPDPTPHEITLRDDFKRPLTIAEQIARFTAANDFQKLVNASGLDTLEDADDLEVDDDTEALFGRTPYETREDVLDGHQTRLDEIRGGQLQEPDFERVNRAQERLKRKPEPVAKEKATEPVQ